MTVTADTLATTDINLVAAASLLIPALRSRSSETDALAHLPDSTTADSRRHMFDLLAPKMYGGLQSSLRTFMDVVVKLGRGDGSAAWRLLSLGQHLDSGNALSKAHRRQKSFRRRLSCEGLAPPQGEDKSHGFDRRRIVEFQ
jgi:hypothetical protein